MKIIHLEKNKINIDSLEEENRAFIKNNKLILKSQQRFKSERHYVFTEDINKTALSANNDKRKQSMDSLKTFAYGTSEDLICEKKKVNVTIY